MKPWITILVSTVVAVGNPTLLMAQAPTGAGSRPSMPATGPRPGPSRPAPPSTIVPPGTKMPPSVPRPGRRPFPLRSPGLGFALVDPWWLWGPSSDDEMFTSPAPEEHAPIGGLQLDVEPRRAQVYVDGSYVGIVDEFKGYYYHLDVPAGRHHVEIITPDYDPLIVDVTVAPGRTTTYRASLNRR